MNFKVCPFEIHLIHNCCFDAFINLSSSRADTRFLIPFDITSKRTDSLLGDFFFTFTPFKTTLHFCSQYYIILIKAHIRGKNGTFCLMRVARYITPLPPLRLWAWHLFGGSRWRSGSSPALCTTEPRFDPRSRRCSCIWFPVHTTCFRRFFSGPSSFPPASKTRLLK